MGRRTILAVLIMVLMFEIPGLIIKTSNKTYQNNSFLGENVPDTALDCKNEGTYKDGSTCKLCADGKWSSGNNSTSCYDCPFGYVCKNGKKEICNGIVSADKRTCYIDGACYCTANGSSCQWMKAGNSSFSVLHREKDKSSCIAISTGCLKGQELKKDGDKTYCVACAEGYYNAEDGGTCKKCPSGTIANNSRTYCYTPSSGNNEACYKDVNNNYYFGDFNNQTGFTKINNSKETCNNLKVIKVDENGNTINGATISLEDKIVGINNRVYTIGETNISEFKGNYVIVETTSPNGYEMNSNPINVSIDSEGIISVTGNNIDLGFTNNTRNVILKIKNNKLQEEDKCYVSSQTYCYGKQSECIGQSISISKDKCNNIKIMKVDENNNELKGAIFVLQNESGMQINNYSLGENYITELGKGSYLLKETIAPINYEVSNQDISIKVNDDGIINITGGNNLYITNNNTRNIEVIIQNSSSKKEEKCYVKYGDGKANTYCFGTKEDCSEYTNELEGKTKDTCDENIMCYKTYDGEYIMGKYQNQSEYIPYGANCPACYKDGSGNYRWTESPNSDEEVISNILSEDKCGSGKGSSSSSSNSKLLLILLIVAIIILLLVLKIKNKNKNSDEILTEE